MVEWRGTVKVLFSGLPNSADSGNAVWCGGKMRGVGSNAACENEPQNGDLHATILLIVNIEKVLEIRVRKGTSSHETTKHKKN
jgi:hypothetical protein